MKYIISILLLISATTRAQLVPVCPVPIINFWEMKSFVLEPVPLYDSNPTETERVIFLDFDGHQYKGIWWNQDTLLTLTPSGMSTLEMERTCRITGEDYSNLSFNVTTDSLKFHAAAPGKRMRVVITSYSQWYGNVGGVAFVKSFTWLEEVPCFVFSNLMGYSGKNSGEASSHEAGHTAGLIHQAVWNPDCTLFQTYNPGTGIPEHVDGWAPIQGVGYYQDQTTFNFGLTTASCTVPWNEFDTIKKVTGAIYRNKTPTTTIPLLTGTTSFDGLIINLQTDSFKLVNVIPVILQLKVTSHGNSNISMKLAGVLYDRYDSLNNSFDTTLQPGERWLEVYGDEGRYHPTRYASSGGFTLQMITTGVVIVANRQDSQYYRRRTERWAYEVFTVPGQPLRKAYGELGKATDGLAPGTWYIIKFGAFTNQILKQ